METHLWWGRSNGDSVVRTECSFHLKTHHHASLGHSCHGRRTEQEEIVDRPARPVYRGTRTIFAQYRPSHPAWAQRVDCVDLQSVRCDRGPDSAES